LKSTSFNSQSLKEAFPHCWVEDAISPAVKPRTAEDVQGLIEWARKNKWRILPIGKGTSIVENYEAPEKVFVMLSHRRNQILETNLFDLAVIVESGVEAKTVSETLQEAGFRLAGWFDSYTGSTGGLICGTPGPEVRHLILGVEIIDGRGIKMSFGGRIRKDVSSFDIPGVFAGSRGTLGWLDQVTLRITPLHSPQIEKPKLHHRSNILPTRGIYQKIAEAFDPDHLFLRPSV